MNINLFNSLRAVYLKRDVNEVSVEEKTLNLSDRLTLWLKLFYNTLLTQNTNVSRYFLKKIDVYHS